MKAIDAIQYKLCKYCQAQPKSQLAELALILFSPTFTQFNLLSYLSTQDGPNLKTTSFFWKVEDDLDFSEMEDNLKFLAE